jgi:hypothetical protein
MSIDGRRRSALAAAGREALGQFASAVLREICNYGAEPPFDSEAD